MKRVLMVTMTLLFMCVFVISISAMDPYALTYTNTEFWIESNGTAIVEYGYRFDDATESVTATIKLEKRTLLLFWKDVEVWTITSTEGYDSGMIEYQLESTGTYRCTVTYEATSTNGTVETDEYQAKAEYNPA